MPFAYLHAESTKNIQGYLIPGQGHDSFVSHGVIQPLEVYRTTSENNQSEFISMIGNGFNNLIQYLGWEVMNHHHLMEKQEIKNQTINYLFPLLLKLNQIYVYYLKNTS